MASRCRSSQLASESCDLPSLHAWSCSTSKGCLLRRTCKEHTAVQLSGSSDSDREGTLTAAGLLLPP